MSEISGQEELQAMSQQSSLGQSFDLSEKYSYTK